MPRKPMYETLVVRGVKVPPDLWNKLKTLVYSKGLDISKVVRALIEEYLEDPEFQKKIDSKIMINRIDDEGL